MKIKEFFKNCRYCHHVWFWICRIDESGAHHFESQEIYNHKDFEDIINDYGDEEFDDWSFENSEDDAIITFVLKRYI